MAWFMLKSVLNVPLRLVRKGAFAYIREDAKSIVELRQSMSALLGDVMFECPADLYSSFLNDRGVKVFRYLWGHQPTTSAWPRWVGPTHYDDVGFTMGSQINIKARAEKSGQANEGLLGRLANGPTRTEEGLLRETLKMIGSFLYHG